jgi:hypothetical protein
MSKPDLNTEDKISICAAAAHEANRLYCASLGDMSQSHWEDAPVWQQVSCIKGVRGILAGATAEQSHEGWLKEKQETGWKYGPVKDVEAKTHPCFVPYAELPEDQRKKDDLYSSTILIMASVLGLK